MGPRVPRDRPPRLSRLVAAAQPPVREAKCLWDQGFRPDRVSPGCAGMVAELPANMRLPAGSRLAISVSQLWRANACRDAALRHNRVSPLGTERGQDQLGVPGRGARPRRRRPGRPAVILVVGPGHRAVPASPRPTVLGMPPLLTRRGPAGPLAGAEPGMGTEEGLTERTTPAPRSSGHRCTSQMEGVTIPDPRARTQAGCMEVRGTELGWPLQKGNSRMRDH
jgi:hypothetical protein